MICMPPRYGRAPPEEAHILPTVGPFRETYARSGATISNQILGHEGELPPEIGEGASRGRTRRAGRFKFVSSESLLCHGLGFKGSHCAHGAQTQTPSRDYTGRISKI